MGVILESAGDQTNCLELNWWNWRPIVAAISRSGILARDEIAQMSHNGATKVSAMNARAIGEYLSHLLNSAEVDAVLRLDGEWQKHQPDESIFWTQGDAKDNYAATHEALSLFVRFCESSRGFTVY